MLINNYHTHTKRCHHAIDEDEDYIKVAIKANMQTLGFSDHIPFKKDVYTRIRMDISEMDEYLTSLYALKQKYCDQITIKVGFEAEYIDEEIPFYKELLESKKVDYLILGNHLLYDYQHSSQKIDSNEQLNEYVNRAIAGMRSGLFKYLAHPDLFMVNIKEFDEACQEAAHRICDEALALNLPLEYNCEGLRDTLKGHIWNNGTNIAYPHPEFWKIVAEKGNKVILGADAHSSQSLNDEAVATALKQVKELKLNIINHLDF